MVIKMADVEETESCMVISSDEGVIVLSDDNLSSNIAIEEVTQLLQTMARPLCKADQFEDDLNATYESIRLV